MFVVRTVCINVTQSWTIFLTKLHKTKVAEDMQQLLPIVAPLPELMKMKKLTTLAEMTIKCTRCDHVSLFNTTCNQRMDDDI